MSPEFEKYELIDAYLDGKLNGAELQSFQTKMNVDPVFKADVNSQQAANEFIMDSGMIELKAKMDAFRPVQKSVPRTLQLFIVAAGAAMLTGFMAWFIHSDDQKLTSPVVLIEELESVDKQSDEISSTPNISSVNSNHDVAIIADGVNIAENENSEIESIFEKHDVARNEESSTEKKVITDFGEGHILVSSDLIHESSVDIDQSRVHSDLVSDETSKDIVYAPHSIFVDVKFDEYYKYVDVDVVNYGDLLEPYQYYINDKKVDSFKNIDVELRDVILKVVDKDGQVGIASLNIYPVEGEE